MSVAVAARSITSITTAATSASITLPTTGASTGDLYLVLINPGVNATLTTTSTGWTKVGQAGTSDPTVAIFAGIQGSVGALTVSSTASTVYTYACFRITGAGSVSSISFASATGSGFNAQSPTLTPSQGTTQYVWIAAASAAAGGDEPTTGPSGWSNLQSNDTFGGGSSSDADLSTAELVATAASESPSAWSSGFSSAWIGLTLAIPSSIIVTSDTATGTDTATVKDTTAVSDTGAGTDSATVAPQATDTATGTESAALTAQATDTATGTDSATVIVRPSADTGTGTDSALPAAQVPVTPDSASGTDSAAVASQATEAATGTEAASVTATAPATDTATGTESATVDVEKPATDTATGTDTAIVRVGVPMTDTATATESMTVIVQAHETATGTDSARSRHAGQGVPARLRLIKVLPRLPVWTGPGR